MGLLGCQLFGATSDGDFLSAATTENMLIAPPCLLASHHAADYRLAEELRLSISEKINHGLPGARCSVRVNFPMSPGASP